MADPSEASPAPSSFTLNEALEAVGAESVRGAAARLSAQEERLAELRAEVARKSRENYVLERELLELDESISLLVKNRITLHELEANSRSLGRGGEPGRDEAAAAAASPVQANRRAYESMVFLVSTQPRYLSMLARLLPSGRTQPFVELVVHQLFADQFHGPTERMLLDVFRRVLEAEVRTSHSGSVLRANTCASQLLTAYARRGQGLAVLKDVLTEPIQEVLRDRELDLEVSPQRVYLALLDEQETRDGRTEMRRDAPPEEVAAHPEVRERVARRQQRLLELSDKFCERIFASEGRMPHGMRVIARHLRDLCRDQFPDLSRGAIGSLIGGFVLLRFFSPAIVTPDAQGIVQSKPSRTGRRNLVLITKVLQNMSNNVLFGDKEEFLTPLNDYLAAKSPLMTDYLMRLADVDDTIDDELEVDRYLGQAARLPDVTVSYNQLVFLHAEMHEHIDTLAPRPDDPLRKAVAAAGAPPERLPRSEDRTITMQLIDRRSKRLSTAVNHGGAGEFTRESHPLYAQAKDLLLSVLRLLPGRAGDGDATLLEFLATQRAAAEAEGNASLATHIDDVVAALRSTAELGLMTPCDGEAATFDQFLREAAAEALKGTDRLRVVERRIGIVERARDTIERHHRDLQQRLDLYKQYLDTVRRGGSQQPAAGDGKDDGGKRKKKGKRRDPSRKVYKCSHGDLEGRGIITRTDEGIPRSVLKKCQYEISMAAEGSFQIEMSLKKGVELKMLKEPIVIRLEDLLLKQREQQRDLDLGYISCNVNRLLHLFNTEFIVEQ